MNIAGPLVAGAIGAGALIYAYYRGRNVEYMFKRTLRNLELVKTLKKGIPDYSPTLYLPSGYLKTLSNFQIAESPDYYREIIPVSYGGQVALDHYRPRKSKSSISDPRSTDALIKSLSDKLNIRLQDRSKEEQSQQKEVQVEQRLGDSDSESPKPPLILVIPGFGTDSTHDYIYKAVQVLASDKVQKFDVCVFNQKGMGNIPFKGTDLLGYWNVIDLEAVLTHLSKSYSNIHLLGFSVGANLLQTFLSDMWDKKRETENPEIFSPKWRPYTRKVENIQLLNHIVSSACISPIYNFDATCRNISTKAWLNPVLNSKYFAIIEKNIQYEEFKAALKQNQFDLDEIKKLKTFRELNGYLIRKGLRMHDVDEALEVISPWQNLANVQTPIMCISSLDDILVDNNYLPVETTFSNEHFLLLVVASGGHISYSHGWTNENWSVVCAQKYFEETHNKKQRHLWSLAI
jgi:predicted alpha/beta-fold hydrolase